MKTRILSIIIFCCIQSLIGMEQDGKPILLDLREQSVQRISMVYAVLSLNFTADSDSGYCQRLIFPHYDLKNKQYVVSIGDISEYITTAFKQIPQSSCLMIDPRYRDTQGEIACNLIRQDFEEIRNKNLRKEQWVINFLYETIKGQQTLSQYHINSLVSLIAHLEKKQSNDAVSACKTYHTSCDKQEIAPLDQLINDCEKKETAKADRSFQDEDYCSLY